MGARSIKRASKTVRARVRDIGQLGYWKVRGAFCVWQRDLTRAFDLSVCVWERGRDLTGEVGRLTFVEKWERPSYLLREIGRRPYMCKRGIR